MPTLPLYMPNPVSLDASHAVRSPGGYEWWYFDAEDASSDTRIVAILLHGFVFHPGYLRQYFRYLRMPTRFAPPAPDDAVCAYFVVYRRGKIAHQFMTQYPASRFAASTERPAVAIGPNRFEVDDSAGGSLDLSLSGTPWKLTARGPRKLDGRTLSAQLSFKPRLAVAPVEREFFSRRLAGADHRWVLANPLCDVSGTIRVADETIEFAGRGYHDHNYGAAPIGPGLRRWFWGRVLTDDRAVTFHFATPRDPVLPDETHLLDATADGIIERPVQVQAKWNRISSALLRYPSRVTFGQELELTKPHVIDAQPFYLRLQYDALIQSTNEPRTGRAFCEIAYPSRLRWPLLGRMIEMSIDKRSMFTP